MEEIPNNRSSKYIHDHIIVSHRMQRLDEILVNYPIKNINYHLKKRSITNLKQVQNRLNNYGKLYKNAIKYGFVCGLLAGGIIWTIFLIITS